MKYVEHVNKKKLSELIYAIYVINYTWCTYIFQFIQWKMIQN